MSLEEINQVVITLASEIKEDKILCIPFAVTATKDRYDRSVLTMLCKCKNYGNVIFVYSPMKARLLAEAMKKLNITNITHRCLEFTKYEMDKIKDNYSKPYPVFLPTKLIKCEEI